MAERKQDQGLLERFNNGVDRVIGMFSPKEELERRMCRMANTFAMRGVYEGARRDPARADWLPRGGSADEDLLDDLGMLRQRSRDLDRNDAIASGISSTMVYNVIGHGLCPQSQVDKERIGLDDAAATKFQSDAEKIWERWAPFADTGGRMSFWEMQQVIIRQVIMNGEVLFLREMITDEPWRPYNLALNMIEADRLDTPSDKFSDKSIRRGVELGSRGQPIAYWICNTHPGDLTYSKRSPDSKQYVRVPIRSPYGQLNALHLYWIKRPGQTRGEPFLAPVLNKFKDLSDYMEAELIANKIAACFALFIKQNNPYDTALKATSRTENDKRIEELYPGLIERLGPGEEVQTVNPTRPGAQFDPFVDKILCFIGASIGLPRELVLKDFGKSNYSNTRAALLEARKMFKCKQLWLSEKFCQPVFNLLIEEAFLRGEVTAPNFYEYAQDYSRSKWIGPGWGYIDPEKEINAATEAINNNLSTLADECAAHGRDWEDVLTQRQREEALRKQLGLPDINGNDTTITIGKTKNNSGATNAEENQ